MNTNATTQKAAPPLSPMKKRQTRSRKAGTRVDDKKKKKSSARTSRTSRPSSSGRRPATHDASAAYPAIAHRPEVPTINNSSSGISRQGQLSRSSSTIKKPTAAAVTRRTEGNRSGTGIKWIIHIDAPGGHAPKLTLVQGLETFQEDDELQLATATTTPISKQKPVDHIQNFVEMQLAATSTTAAATTATAVSSAGESSVEVRNERDERDTSTCPPTADATATLSSSPLAPESAKRQAPGRLDSGLSQMSRAQLLLADPNEGDDTITGSDVLSILSKLEYDEDSYESSSESSQDDDDDDNKSYANPYVRRNSHLLPEESCREEEVSIDPMQNFSPREQHHTTIFHASSLLSDSQSTIQAGTTLGDGSVVDGSVEEFNFGRNNYSGQGGSRNNSFGRSLTSLPEGSVVSSEQMAKGLSDPKRIVSPRRAARRSREVTAKTHECNDNEKGRPPLRGSAKDSSARFDVPKRKLTVGEALVGEALAPADGNTSIPNLTAGFANDFFGPQGVLTSAVLNKSPDSEFTGGNTLQNSAGIFSAVTASTLQNSAVMNSSTTSASSESSSSAYSFGFNRRVLQSKSFDELTAIRNIEQNGRRLLDGNAGIDGHDSSPFVQLDISAQDGFQVMDNEEVKEKKAPVRKKLTTRSKSDLSGSFAQLDVEQNVGEAIDVEGSTMKRASSSDNINKIRSADRPLEEEDAVSASTKDAPPRRGFGMRTLSSKASSRRQLKKKQSGSSNDADVKKRFFAFGNSSMDSKLLDDEELSDISGVQ